MEQLPYRPRNSRWNSAEFLKKQRDEGSCYRDEKDVNVAQPGIRYSRAKLENFIHRATLLNAPIFFQRLISVPNNMSRTSQ